MQQSHPKTTAKHIIFVYSLHEALCSYKYDLGVKSNENSLTNDEQQQYDFFQKRGAIMIAISAMSSCMETIIDRKITDLFSISFGNSSVVNSKKEWLDILPKLAPLFPHLGQAIDRSIRGQDAVKPVISLFVSLVSSTRSINAPSYERFIARVKIG